MTTAGSAALTIGDLGPGIAVSFRPSFSDGLIGIVWEISAHADGLLHHIEHESLGGRVYCVIRTRVGKRSPRWAYRMAYVTDLIRA